MLCVIHRIDDPERTYLRKVHRDEHLVHLNQYRARILLAGPYLDPATGADRGSMFLMRVADLAERMFLMRVADLAEARRFAEDDPYMRHGVFRHVEVWEWTRKTGSVDID